MQMWWIFATTPHHTRIISSRAIHQGCQGNYTCDKNSRPQTPFTIRERQLQAIDKLAHIFNSMQPEKTQTTVFQREVPTIALTRVPVTLEPPRVPATVAPLRVMTLRAPIITEEDPI